MKTSNISQLIWSIADDLLRGYWTKQDYRKPILPFFVLKRLDLVLADTKSSVVKQHIELTKKKVKDQSSLLIKASKHNFYNYSEYDFNNLLADPNNLEKNLKFYLNHLFFDLRTNTLYLHQLLFACSVMNLLL